MPIELASRTVPLTAGGVPGSALGMMSRGKVNELALSVFLPRDDARQPPFRQLSALAQLCRSDSASLLQRVA